MFAKIKNFLFQDLTYRFQQFIIIIAHLILLNWMIYALRLAGGLKFTTVMIHFLGMGLYGAILIYGTSWWAKKRYQNEINDSQSEQA